MYKNALVLGAVISQAACGGGGSGGGSSEPGPKPSTAKAAGMWTGTANNGASVTGVVLSDTRYYFLYADEFGLAGVIAGNASLDGDKFTSSNALDYHFGGGIYSGDINATFVEKQYLTGGGSYEGGGSVEFSTGYDDDWEITPFLTDIMGQWTGDAVTSVGEESTVVNIDLNGSVAAEGAGGCAFSGTVAPRKDGNVFDMSITAAESDLCAVEYRGKTIKGVMLLNGGTLYALGADPGRQNGVFFTGEQPL